MLVLDFYGSGGSGNGESLALFHGKRFVAGDTQRPGTQVTPHHNHQQIAVT